MVAPWKNWLILVLGIWIAVSPYVADPLAIDIGSSNVASGTIIVIVALWNLFGKKK